MTGRYDPLPADGLLKLAYDWQTLESGVIAIFAAIIAGGFIVWQTKRGENRRRRAVRAALPLLLNEIIDWTTRVAALVYQLERYRVTLPGGLNPISPPSPADIPAMASMLLGLREAVETLPKSASERSAHVLRAIQITAARLSDLFEDVFTGGRVVTQSDVEVAVVDLTELRALAESMFEYGRQRARKVDLKQPAPAAIGSSYNQLWRDKINVENFDEKYVRRTPK